MTAATGLAVTIPASKSAATQGADPMEIRWAVQCGVRDKHLDSGRAGFVGLPFGAFFALNRFRCPEEIHSTDDNPNFPRSHMVTRTADSVQLYLAEMLGGKDGEGNPDPGKINYGIQFGFRGVEDLAYMAVISATVLPTLQTIRAFAKATGIENPIGERCDGQDVGDFVERTACPTCWAAWIESDLCKAYLDTVIKNGMECSEIDGLTKEATVRLIKPTTTDLDRARLMARDALHAGIAAMQSSWLTIVDELEKGERRGIDQYQMEIRRDVHGVKPQDKQVAMVREFGRASQQANTSSDVSELLAQMAKSQLRTEQLLGEVLGKRSTGNMDVTAEAKAPAAKNGGK